MFKKLLDILFPKTCVSCQKEGAFICKTCFDQIKITHPVIRNPNFKDVLIPCSFHKNPVLRKALHRLKYSFYKDISCELSRLFDSVIIPPNSIIVPIPLHKSRLKYRGFNQSEALAEKLNKPVIRLLERRKKTKSQATLSRTERNINMQNSFTVNENLIIDKAAPLILLDDVCTTFSTMNEAAITLKNAGFKILYAMAVAYSELKSNK